MSSESYQKQPGDFEIRFLKDGRVVFVGPDQELLDLANHLDLVPDEKSSTERNQYEPDDPSPAQENE